MLFGSLFFFFQAEDGIRDADVTGVQTCALPICAASRRNAAPRGHGRGLPRARRQSRRAPAHQPIQFPIVARGAVYALLLWAPLASGAWRPWPLAVCGLLAGVGGAAWLLEHIVPGRLSSRRTPLDLPVLLLVA